MKNIVFICVLLVASLKAFAGETSPACKGCPLPHLKQFYVGASGVGTWSGKFSGGGAMIHLGYPFKHYQHGDCSLEFETGYIKQTAHASASYGNGSFSQTVVSGPYQVPAGTDKVLCKRSRKATLEMVPLMLNLVYKANLDYWFNWKTPLVWELGGGLGVNIVNTEDKVTNDWYIVKTDGVAKFDESETITEKRSNHCEFAGQVFTRVGWQLTPKCAVYTGARAFFTGEQHFSSSKIAGLTAHSTHVLVDLGINYHF